MSTSKLYIAYAAFLAFLMLVQAVPQSFAIKEQSDFAAAINDWESLTERAQSVGQYDIYKFGLSAKVPNYIFLGDSHLEQYLPRIRSIFAKSSRPPPATWLVRARGCEPFLIEATENESERSGKKSCSISNKLLFEFLEEIILAQPNDDFTIVLAYCWNCHLKTGDPNDYFLKLLDRVGRLVPLSKVHIVLDNPMGSMYSPKTLIGIGESRVVEDEDLHFVPFDSRQKYMNDIAITVFDKSEVRYSNVAARLCRRVMAGKQYCARIVDKRPVFKDEDHLNATFVVKHAVWIDKIFQ